MNRKQADTPSLFTPIVMIAIGAVWLLANLGWLPAIDWSIVWSLWPLGLIFLGLNMIVRQAPRPLGALLSALVGLTAVATFGYVLLFSQSLPEILVAPPAEIEQHEISYPLRNVARARMEIDSGSADLRIAPLTSPDLLLAGEIANRGALTFDGELADGVARVTVADGAAGLPLRLHPAEWTRSDDGDELWQIELAKGVPLELLLDGGRGSVELDLSELQLESLAIDSGSGATTVLLPAGLLDVAFDGGSGSSTWRLASDTSGRLSIDGGSGQITLLLPSGVEAQLTIDQGSGAVRVDERFERVDGEEGIWQTAGYSSADRRIDIAIDGGSGAITVQQPTGR